MLLLVCHEEMVWVVDRSYGKEDSMDGREWGNVYKDYSSSLLARYLDIITSILHSY